MDLILRRQRSKLFFGSILCRGVGRGDELDLLVGGDGLRLRESTTCIRQLRIGGLGPLPQNIGGVDLRLQRLRGRACCRGLGFGGGHGVVERRAGRPHFRFGLRRSFCGISLGLGFTRAELGHLCAQRIDVDARAERIPCGGQRVAGGGEFTPAAVQGARVRNVGYLTEG